MCSRLGFLATSIDFLTACVDLILEALSGLCSQRYSVNILALSSACGSLLEYGFRCSANCL